MEIENKIVSAVVLGIKTLYGQDIAPETVQLQKTKKEFAGHLTLVCLLYTSDAADEL